MTDTSSLAASARRPITTLERTSDTEIVITRTFAGPARIVFDAWTRPELVERWYAPRSHATMVRCEADVRVDGSYRYVIAARGHELAYSGRYTEVVPHSRLAYTSVFEPMADGGEGLTTVTFEEQDGVTHVVLRATYPSKEALDSAIEVGMEHGMRETMEQLAEVVASAS